MEGGARLRAASTGTARKKEFFPLNMAMAKVIDDLFHADPVIQQCRGMRHGYVFRGGLKIVWGGGVSERAMEPGAQETEDLIELLSNALDWRDKFGFCPFKLAKDRRTGTRSVVVPEFGTGAFVRSLNWKTLKTDVHFTPYDRGTSDPSRKDGSVRVFVWPGRAPALSGAFKSAMATLIERNSVIRELEWNALDADWNAAHPTLFTQTRAQKRDFADLTESEMYEDRCGIEEFTVNEKLSHRHYQFRAADTRAIAHRLSAGVRAFASRGSGQCTGDEALTGHKRKRAWADAIEPLPDGEELARSVDPNSRSDVLEWRREYEDIVCTTMGVPRSFFGGGGSRRFKGESEHDEGLVHAAVVVDRDDANRFFKAVYSAAHRERDAEVIVRGFLDLDDAEDALRRSGGATKGALGRVKEGRRRIERIAQDARAGNLVSLCWNEDPFTAPVEIAAVLTAADRGAITREEEINLLRAKVSLKKCAGAAEFAELEKRWEEARPPPSSSERKKEKEKGRGEGGEEKDATLIRVRR